MLNKAQKRESRDFKSARGAHEQRPVDFRCQPGCDEIKMMSARGCVSHQILLNMFRRKYNGDRTLLSMSASSLPTMVAPSARHRVKVRCSTAWDVRRTITRYYLASPPGRWVSPRPLRPARKRELRTWIVAMALRTAPGMSAGDWCARASTRAEKRSPSGVRMGHAHKRVQCHAAYLSRKTGIRVSPRRSKHGGCVRPPHGPQTPASRSDVILTALDRFMAYPIFGRGCAEPYNHPISMCSRQGGAIAMRQCGPHLALRW
jgi:hypothetical protein